MKSMMKKMMFAGIAVLGLVATQSHAALMTTPVQSQSYSGVAGNASGVSGVLPFLFNKFDSTLGTLQRVVMRASFNISGGLISADNMTNQIATGTGYLGASLSFSAPTLLINSAYQPMFSGLELTQFGNFTLAADPTMSVGGTGPDVGTIYGGNYTMATPWQTLADLFQGDFIGAGKMRVDFDTDSEVAVNVVGARGSFEAVNTLVSMDLYYEYESVDEPAPAPVSAPIGFALAGLGLMLLSSRRQKK